MCQYLELKHTPKDGILYKEGDPADYVYILQTGEFEIFKRIKGDLLDGDSSSQDVE